MHIRLDSKTVVSGSTLGGMVSGAPAGGARLVIRATVTTPFGSHVIVERHHEVGDGLFGLPAPSWPISSDGPVVQTTWSLDIVDDHADIVDAVPFDLMRSGSPAGATISVNALDNDDLESGHRVLPRRLAAYAGAGFAAAALGATLALVLGWLAIGIALAAMTLVATIALAVGYDFERRHVIEHDTRCRVDVVDRSLDCTVRLRHRDADLPAVDSVIATLLVVETARWNRPDGGHAEREATVFERAASLDRLDDRTWRGTIPHLPADEAPLSWFGRLDLDEWGVHWGVRFAVHGVGDTHDTHVVHLVARPDDVAADEVGAPAHPSSALG